MGRKGLVFIGLATVAFVLTAALLAAPAWSAAAPAAATAAPAALASPAAGGGAPDQKRSTPPAALEVDPYLGDTDLFTDVADCIQCPAVINCNESVGGVCCDAYPYSCRCERVGSNPHSNNWKCCDKGPCILP